MALLTSQGFLDGLQHFWVIGIVEVDIEAAILGRNVREGPGGGGVRSVELTWHLRLHALKNAISSHAPSPYNGVANGKDIGKLSGTWGNIGFEVSILRLT